MKKKERRKQEQSVPENVTETSTRTKSEPMPSSKREKSDSRSRSRGRRSLSSLFRRSRPESGERSESRESAVSNEDINPKLNPRGYLQRMTVREALAYNRHKGRSPDRRVIKLEKKILDNDPRLSADDRSASLPYLVDEQVDQTIVQELHSTSLAARSGSTLPRVKKRRRKGDGNASVRNMFDSAQSEIFPDERNKSSQILPLDKRKYLIEQETDLDEIDNAHTLDVNFSSEHVSHSKNETEFGAFNIPSESDIKRHESLNKFLILRDTKPSEAQFPITNEQLSDYSVSHKSIVPHDLSTVDKKSQISAEVEDTTSSVKQPTDLESTGCEKLDSKNCPENEHVSTVASPSIPGKSTSSDNSKQIIRTSYVSPRRFTRTSRSSITSNRSLVSDTSSLSEIMQRTETDTQPVLGKKTNNPQHNTVTDTSKNRRHFNRESRKRTKSNDIKDTDQMKTDFKPPVRQHVDASTSMDSLVATLLDIKLLPEQKRLVESETNTTADIELSETTILENKHYSLSENAKLLTHEKDEKPVVASVVYPQVRDVKVISVEQSNLESEETHFKPIQSESDISGEVFEKDENNEDGDKTEPIVLDKTENFMKLGLGLDVAFDLGDIQDKNTNKSKRIKQKECKKNASLKHKESFGKKDKDSKLETIEKTKKGKKKSKTGKGKRNKDSQDSITDIVKPRSSIEEDSNEINELSLSEREVQPPKQEYLKPKKKKGILKRHSKEKEHRSVSHAIKSVARTASLSDVLDKAEYVSIEKRRQSVNLRGKRSRSLEFIAKKDFKTESDVNNQEVVRDSVTSDVKVHKEHGAKSNLHQPKLSIAAIVALKSKIARMKRSRLHKSGENDSDTRRDSNTNNEIRRTSKNSKSEDPNDDSDFGLAKIFYENEINASYGKPDNTIEIIGDADKEITSLIYEKKIQFAPYCDDTISEEEMIKQRQRNTRLTNRRESKVRQRQKKVINCCKKFVAFLFSHIGLCSLVVAYCIAGGLIFKSLEGDHEIEQKKEIKALRENYTEKIHRLAFETTLTKGSREEFKNIVGEILKNFSIVIHKLTKEAGWDGKEVQYTQSEDGEQLVDQNAEPEQWSYPSSLLFAITVMTTIGYGHVAPKTDEGRIMTIAYAVLGIPLTLLCLTNIGDVMAHGFRMLYGKVCCGLCCILFRPRRRRRLDPEKGITAGEERLLMQENQKSEEIIHVPTSVCLLLMSSYIMLGTFLFSEWEGWDMVTGTYFCFITLSTIGFGDVVPGMSRTDWDQNEKLVSCALYLLFGLSLIAMCFNLVQEDVKAKCRWLGMKLGIIDKPVSSV